MIICVLSDSHGSKKKVWELLNKKKYDYIFFLGDGLSDMEDFCDDNVKKVSGNCDFWATEPITQTIAIGKYKFMLTHGHEYKAKHSVFGLLKPTTENGCNVVCFGHTHKQLFEQIEGVYFINPGSLKNNDFAEIIIEDENMSVNLKKYE